MEKQTSTNGDKDSAVPIRKSLSSVPISDPEDRLFNRKLKSYSQPLTRLDLHQPPYDHRRKQHSLQLSSSSSYPSYSPFVVNPNPNSPPPPLPTAPLPEFTGSGGGGGIFSLPRRAPVHPGRPPPLELRPHPFRETQSECSIRAIASSRTHLWAAQENGVRCWDLGHVFKGYREEEEEGEGEEREREGDEETAPYWESTKILKKVAVTTCLAVDEGRGLVWSGHKDGIIKSWSMVKGGGGGEEDSAAVNFKQAASWQAHRCAVLSLVVTSCGKW